MIQLRSRVKGSLLLAVTPFLFSAATAAPAADRRPSQDPQIRAMVNAVSAERLRHIDTQLVSFGTRNLFSENLGSPHRGVFAARDFLVREFTDIARVSGGRMTVALDSYAQAKTERTPRSVEVSSVVATLRGDDPASRIYVISSHFDSRNSDGNDATRDAPGADDNGSGVSCVVEAARVMAAYHFRGTIIFAAYDGEEQGLFGSGHHAKVLHDAGLNVDGVLNNDIMGASLGHGGERTPRKVRLFSEALPLGAEPARVNARGTENDSPARELARFVKETAEQYVPLMQADLTYRTDRFLRGGDQQSFAEQGFPAVRFVEANENYDHQHQDVRVENGIQYGDLQNFMDFAYLARVTKMNVAALAALALGPSRPANAQMLAKQLSYDTTLQWDRVPEAASYELVWRPTTAPTWTFSKLVGNTTSATIPVSKDNFFIGVRAVDSGGHRSVVAFPVPLTR